jgi:hypothetical protein
MPDYFYIYFSGLICHMGYGSRKHFAAIVKDEDHEPVVWYDDGKYFPIDADTESLKFKIGNSVTEADAEATPDFLRFVPSLQRLMGGNPRMNIKKYAIPVNYPATGAGSPDLDVFALYDTMGWYRRFDQELRAPDCVAALTGVVVDAPPGYKLQVTQIKVDGSVKDSDPYDPNKCIVISNQPKDSDHNTRGHAMKYAKILIGNESIVTVLQPGDCKVQLRKEAHCPWVNQLVRRASTDVECGNTGWP